MVVRIWVSLRPWRTMVSISWRTARADDDVLWATDRSWHEGHFTRFSRCAMRCAGPDAVGPVTSARATTATSATAHNRKAPRRRRHDTPGLTGLTGPTGPTGLTELTRAPARSPG